MVVYKISEQISVYTYIKKRKEYISSKIHTPSLQLCFAHLWAWIFLRSRTVYVYMIYGEYQEKYKILLLFSTEQVISICRKINILPTTIKSMNVGMKSLFQPIVILTMGWKGLFC